MHEAPGRDRERDQHQGGHATPADQDREDRDGGERRPEPREMEAIGVEDRDATIPRKSSTTASVSRNARNAVGRRLPKMVRTANAKAMSVAMGMAHPSIAPPSLVALTSA